MTTSKPHDTAHGTSWLTRLKVAVVGLALAAVALVGVSAGATGTAQPDEQAGRATWSIRVEPVKTDGSVEIAPDGTIDEPIVTYSMRATWS
jgi:hypothetical protein